MKRLKLEASDPVAHGKDLLKRATRVSSHYPPANSGWEDLERTFRRYESLAPTLIKGSFAEWVVHRFNPGASPYYGTREARQLRIFYDFFADNLVDPNQVRVNSDRSLDDEYVGSSARVYEAEMGGNSLAAKVFRERLLKRHPHVVPDLIREGINLSIVGALEVGPQFHGFTFHDGALTILMDKIEGRELESDEGRRALNEKSLKTFQSKAARLHQVGLHFSLDSGQMLVGADGTIYFMDISSLYFLRRNNLIWDSRKKKGTPVQQGDWYVERMSELQGIMGTV